MQLCPFSYDFPDWLRAQLLGIGAPEITDENPFDCRHLDLVERIRKAITSALGRCAVLELPQAEPTEDKEDTYALIHTVSVTLTIVREPLCRVDTTAIAETLYRFFLPATFAPWKSTATKTTGSASDLPGGKRGKKNNRRGREGKPSTRYEVENWRNSVARVETVNAKWEQCVGTKSMHP